MNNVKQLSRESAALAVIDMQEAFRPVMPDFGDVASRIAKAVDGAKLLGGPVIVTEQYPKGLKHTAKEILARLPAELTAIEKSCFSSCGAEDFLAQLTSRNIKQVLVCGIEAHICVLQTSLDLLAKRLRGLFACRLHHVSGARKQTGCAGAAGAGGSHRVHARDGAV